MCMKAARFDTKMRMVWCKDNDIRGVGKRIVVVCYNVVGYRYVQTGVRLMV